MPAAEQPDLHFFLTADIRTLDLRDAVEHQLRIGALVSEMLEVVIRHHVDTARRLVIEGDAILPDLAVRKAHAGLSTEGRVRAVFVEETDPDHVYAALRRRRRGSDSKVDQRRWAEFHHAHGRVLSERARAVGIPVISARSRSSLMARMRATAGI